MQFREVVGQQAAKNGIIYAAISGKLPHAMLLLGREGTGGLPLALAVAQYLFCERPTETDSCGSCPACGRMARLEHPDLHLSYPVIKPEKVKSEHLTADVFGKDFRKFVHHNAYDTIYNWLQAIDAGNKQGNIPAAECRNIIEKLSFKPFEGDKKVLILWGAEYLDKEGNMLLKLIEEPPAGTHMIFISSLAEEILPTILSRVQTVRLPPLSNDEIITALQEKGIAGDARSASLAAINAEGSFGEALQLAAGGGDDLFPQFRDWFNAIYTGKGIFLTTFADTLSKQGRESARAFLQYATHLLQAALVQHYAPGAPLHFPAEEAGFIRRLANHKSTSVESISAMSEALAHTAHSIEGNANAKIQLHALGIQLARIVREPVAA